MKNLLLIALATGFGILVLASLVHPPSFIADRNLERAVRTALGTIRVGRLVPSNVDGLEELDARGFGIVSLEGIEYCTGLKKLRLGNSVRPLWGKDNRIVDISPLAALVDLEELYLDENRIVDISPLTELVNLKTLSLSWNEIADVSSLEGLTNLEYLALIGNQVDEIGALARNMGLGEGDHVHLFDNKLNYTQGDPDMDAIHAISGRGAFVSY